jgi:hypothetical protein
MKKLFVMLLSVGCSIIAQASTDITTGPVSGRWNLAGSPYIIHNDVAVGITETLTIDPGVEVIMAGDYKFIVFGSLLARGTASLPISFHRDDTTGWAGTGPGGGWQGIEIGTYGMPEIDSTVLEYCNISDGKSGALTCNSRNLAIRHCNLFHHQTGMLLSTNAGQLIEVSNTAVYDCQAPTSGVFFISSFFGGSLYMHHNSIYHNTGEAIIYGGAARLLFTDNELYENYANTSIVLMRSTSSMRIHYSHSQILRNTLHHNECVRVGAILCDDGFADVIGNLVCNNSQTLSGFCGALDGGAGIRVNGNSTMQDSNSFNIQNNVVANNFAAFDGSGIKVYYAKANVVNNHLINNNCDRGGPMGINAALLPINIRNNIFYGNTGGNGDLVGSSNGLVTFEHNWLSNPLYRAISLYGYDSVSSYTRRTDGDTLSNIIGTDPLMVAPTLTSGVAESALGANFALQLSSPCINMGDTAGLFIDSVDYMLVGRVSGWAIDIGAFEVHPLSELGTGAVSNVALPVATYPNPTQGIINVQTPETGGTITVTGMDGRTVAVLSVVTTNTKIDLQEQPKGNYIVSWISAKGIKTAKKIVLQ